MKKVMAYPGALGYAVYNTRGIPIKFNHIEYNQVVEYAGLILDLLIRSRSNLRKLEVLGGDHEVSTIRLRTARDTELIISCISEFYMLVIQQCESQRLKMQQEGAIEEEQKEAS